MVGTFQYIDQPLTTKETGRMIAHKRKTKDHWTNCSHKKATKGMGSFQHHHSLQRHCKTCEHNSTAEICQKVWSWQNSNASGEWQQHNARHQTKGCLFEGLSALKACHHSTTESRPTNAARVACFPGTSPKHLTFCGRQRWGFRSWQRWGSTINY